MKPMITLREPPELSDEAAAKMLDLLQELTTAFENHYTHQLRRYYQPDLPTNLDLFDDLEE